MIPYSYNMVDMGGLDLAEANGTVVDGLYARITEAVNACRDVVLYNWKFAGIEITPQYTTILFGNPITINGAVQVTAQDLVTVPGINPDPPVLVPIEITENGQYYPLEYEADGFSEVSVAVPPPPPPVITPLSVDSNDIYYVPEGVDGFNPVTVAVPPSSSPVIESLSVTGNGTYTAPTGVDGYSPVVVDVDSMTVQAYDPAYDPSVVSSIDGKITKAGPFVTCQLRVVLVSARNLNGIKLFTLPSAVIPSGYFLFGPIGNGGTTTTVKGYIDSNDGGFYIEGSITTHYVYLTASWFVGEAVQITPIAEGISITGGLSISDGIADLHAKVVVNGSSVWKDLFSVPSDYVNGLSPPYLLSGAQVYDSLVSEAGVVRAWLPTGSRTFTVEKTWKFN